MAIQNDEDDKMVKSKTSIDTITSQSPTTITTVESNDQQSSSDVNTSNDTDAKKLKTEINGKLKDENTNDEITKKENNSDKVKDETNDDDDEESLKDDNDLEDDDQQGDGGTLGSLNALNVGKKSFLGHTCSVKTLIDDNVLIPENNALSFEFMVSFLNRNPFLF